MGCYPTIAASDQQTFTAGFVGMLRSYPAHVVDAASDPSHGIPAHVEFPNLARFRQQLDHWRATLCRERPSPLPGLPPIENTPEENQRIGEGLIKLRMRLMGNA